MVYDCIIVGQGICGTFLSFYMQQAGKKVLVMDEWHPNTASRVASGVINPVTGRRIVKTWMIDELIPFCQNAYVQIGDKMRHPVVHTCSVLDFYPTAQMQQAFEKRLAGSESEYLHPAKDVEAWKNIFEFSFGIGEILPALWVDTGTLLCGWRQYLQSNGMLLEERMEFKNLSISPGKIHYCDITAERIVFCDGVAAMENIYFNNLPFAPNKGEAILAEIPDLSDEHIYKQGWSIVPWDKSENLFWVGSTYTWDFDDVLPSEAFRHKVQSSLKEWLRLPYKIVDHLAAVRPANTERRPFVGWHPLFPNVGILNGMGTKGCSLGPYFAHQLTENIMWGTPIDALADIVRFREKIGVTPSK